MNQDVYDESKALKRRRIEENEKLFDLPVGSSPETIKDQIEKLTSKGELTLSERRKLFRLVISGACPYNTIKLEEYSKLEEILKSLLPSKDSIAFLNEEQKYQLKFFHDNRQPEVLILYKLGAQFEFTQQSLTIIKSCLNAKNIKENETHPILYEAEEILAEAVKDSIYALRDGETKCENIDDIVDKIYDISLLMENKFGIDTLEIDWALSNLLKCPRYKDKFEFAMDERVSVLEKSIKERKRNLN